jgi:hypothetical protein
MSKIGLVGTLFTIFTGSIFIVSGLLYIFWEVSLGTQVSIAGLCTIAAIIIILYGITLVAGAFWQWSEIKKGKDFYGSPDGQK